jgi:hypothetical protein
MKLFKSLLIAPATLGLLAPLSAISSEVDFQAISKYSQVDYELDSNSFNHLSTNNTLLSGGEGLVETEIDSPDSFSSTTSATFSAEAILGGLSSDLDFSEAVSMDYQYGIALTSSFTGEDSFDVAIQTGNDSGSPSSAIFDMDQDDDVLIVDGIAYTFPVGGATMKVGDSTDISSLYTGACAYGGFTDYMGDCGTGSSVGVGNDGVTATASYAFDGGFSLAGGISSPAAEVTGENFNDTYGVEAAYAADAYGVSVAFADIETSTFVGVNGYYAFDFATISAGYESEDIDDADDASAFFVGLTKEVGPGTAEIGYASTDQDPLGLEIGGQTYVYEASYAYPVNDALTVTPGLAIIDTDDGESTVAAVKASFAF